ncbi:hypothetical protein IGI04_014164 [Brassica rapa subsp. trilocularis]|uniref:Knottin scorpion toxin-like domain-containing protein n=4 Tax=Brassica TaxID=3705 RepID=A0A3P6C7N5_BRACM|nr:hypothetical protein IGI04_014164 [Brassica rapa subsp. trilocularis]KAH0928206.1 hypothetical protein HID58_013933 [Brassica napus]CAF2264609.1 unnamed protein product [Brassica napus]CAG7905231.1 unnamed protein product [Brassica rapa]VDD10210.1 unnamed protein product [Brassica rapa]
MFTSAIQLHLFISLVSHKMAKNTTFAIFMIVLVLGMVMKETQGQQLCHERFIGATPCVPPQCAEQCTAKWGERAGRGTCLGGPGPANTCLCTFKCQI